MFGLGGIEILILIVIAFLVFGPKEFPIVVKNFVKLFNELRSIFTSVESEFYDLKTEGQKHVQKITKGLEEDFKAVGSIQKEDSKKSSQQDLNKDEK